MTRPEPEGQTASKPNAMLNRPVFFISAVIILGISLAGVVRPEVAEAVFSSIQSWIIDTLGWLYALAIAIFLVFSIVLALGPLGAIKLGPDHSDPDYSYTAGMGIGLMFFGVAEPIMHFTSPPQGEGGTVARRAMPSC